MKPKKSLFLVILILIGNVEVAASELSEKIDQQVIQNKSSRVPVTVLCRTQLLEMPNGYEEFCKQNSDHNRMELRSEVIQRLKEIANNGEQQAVLKTIKGTKVDQHWIINAFSARLTLKQILGIASMDEVKYIYAGFPNSIPSRKRKISEVIKPTQREPFTTAGLQIPWNIKAIGADQVWNKKKVTGENTVVAMLEGGIDYTHQDLRNNIWINTDEKPNNGRDDDENGFIDDYYGFNFRTGSCEVIVETPRHHHGTMTSGIVAGDGTGGIITGVAPRARLMLLSGHAVYAYEYALENGADILSMSFSVPNLGDTRGLWRLMSEQAVCAGLVLVSGCGNFQQSQEIPVQIRIPEGIPCVIGAGGLDNRLDVPSFCSLGPVEWASVKFYEDYPLPKGLIKPDVCAFPGPGYPQLSPDSGEYINNKRGNSFSGPHVAGVAALMFSVAPELPAWRIKQIIEETARDIAAKGKDPLTGAGLINAWKAVLAVEELHR